MKRKTRRMGEPYHEQAIFKIDLQSFSGETDEK